MLMRTPGGGRRKTYALMAALSRYNRSIEQSITIGDSITDEDMLRVTRKGGGLAVSFNGNGYAIKESNVALMSDNCALSVIVAEAYRNGGHDAVKLLAENWSREFAGDISKLSEYGDPSWRQMVLYPADREFPQIYMVTPENVAEVTAASKAWRKRVRGSVGQMG